MKEFIGEMVVASTDAWFYGPDGQQYRAVYGRLEAIQEINKETLGFTPNRPNVNWVYKIGSMFLHGCQVKYMMLCKDRPEFGEMINWEGEKRFKTPNIIYDASAQNHFKEDSDFVGT